jgi:multidrug efflux system membrane fusion protein
MLLLLVTAGYWGWQSLNESESVATAAARNDPAPAVPVTVAKVRKADFAVYLDGLGTVQSFNTVTVRSRVDGEVLSVAFRQGQTVRQGDTLVQIDPRPYQAALDQAIAKKAQDEATLKNARLDLERYASLSKQSFASTQQLDAQQALVDQLDAQIKGDEAAIENAQTQLGYTTIKSPLTGKTGFRLVDPGNIVHASDTGGIVTIVKMQPISIVLTAAEADLPRINKALASGPVPVEALTSDGSRRLGQGKLALVNNQVDQASGTISMKATMANQDNTLWPGLSVSTRMLVETLKDATVVPDSAVQRGPNGPYTFAVDTASKVHIRKLMVDQEGDGLSVITQGILPGDEVVVSGQYRLTDGALVKASAAPGDMAQSQSQEAR